MFHRPDNGPARALAVAVLYSSLVACWLLFGVLNGSVWWLLGFCVMALAVTILEYTTDTTPPTLEEWLNDR